jgi:hypothetical protein
MSAAAVLAWYGFEKEGTEESADLLEAIMDCAFSQSAQALRRLRSSAYFSIFRFAWSIRKRPLWTLLPHIGWD